MFLIDCTRKNQNLDWLKIEKEINKICGGIIEQKNTLENQIIRVETTESINNALVAEIGTKINELVANQSGNFNHSEYSITIDKISTESLATHNLSSFERLLRYRDGKYYHFGNLTFGPFSVEGFPRNLVGIAWRVGDEDDQVKWISNVLLNKRKQFKKLSAGRRILYILVDKGYINIEVFFEKAARIIPNFLQKHSTINTIVLIYRDQFRLYSQNDIAFIGNTHILNL